MMTEIRILTVKQPYAAAEIFGFKKVDNRTRNIARTYRGPVAIHAALAIDWAVFADVISRRGPWGKLTPNQQSTCICGCRDTGRIIGLVDLVDVHWGEPEGVVADWPLCSPWAWGGESCWHLVFKNPRPLPEPVPWKGGQGLQRLDTAVTIAECQNCGREYTVHDKTAAVWCPHCADYVSLNCWRQPLLGLEALL